MAMKMGHHFPSHTFTGSARPGMPTAPTIPGYKRGGEATDEHEMHRSGAKDHYKKGGHVDHDGETHTSHVHYDEHGFQHHKVGGQVKNAIKKAMREHEDEEHEGRHGEIHLRHGGRAHKKR